jgi:hypothetical protein
MAQIDLNCNGKSRGVVREVSEKGTCGVISLAKTRILLLPRLLQPFDPYSEGIVPLKLLLCRKTVSWNGICRENQVCAKIFMPADSGVMPWKATKTHQHFSRQQIQIASYHWNGCGSEKASLIVVRSEIR